MAVKGLWVVLLGVGVVLGGCMQSTIEPASEANLTARDKKLLAAAPYEKPTIAEPYRRHIVQYHRKEIPGTIVVDSDARYLYYVLPDGKAIRYGVTVGEEALAWSGVAKVGRLTEWPTWTPTAEIKKRMDVPDFVGSGPQNPMGARALYLFEGNKDTLYRIHGTNQPEYIGQAISSASAIATQVAERLRDAIESTVVSLETHSPIHFSVSIGCASRISKDDSMDTVLNLADKALYDAKRTGRNRVCVAAQ
jgi:hypothetical protein